MISLISFWPLPNGWLVPLIWNSCSAPAPKPPPTVTWTRGAALRAAPRMGGGAARTLASGSPARHVAPLTNVPRPVGGPDRLTRCYVGGFWGPRAADNLWTTGGGHRALRVGIRRVFIVH